MRTTRSKRRGISSMLAMLYLILFSTLAVGFYSAVTVAVQVSGNEVNAKRAMLNAESGLAFMRYVMGNVQVPHSTPDTQTWTAFCTQVKAQLDGTPNVAGRTIAMPTGNEMILPDMVAEPGGASFTATLTRSGQQILVKVSGGESITGTVRRTIQLSFARAQRASAIFDYGVASRSAISMAGNAKITGAAGALERGSVLSMTASSTPLKMVGGPSISGDFSYTNTAGANVGCNALNSNSNVAIIRLLIRSPMG